MHTAKLHTVDAKELHCWEHSWKPSVKPKTKENQCKIIEKQTKNKQKQKNENGLMKYNKKTTK